MMDEGLERSRLLKVSGDFAYEIQMFYSTRDLIPTDQIQRNKVLLNTVIQSWAIHARNLLHFFYPIKPRDDDVLAKHYLPVPVQDTWTGKLPDHQNDEYERIRTRVDKQVVHLTFQRAEVRSDEKSWRQDIEIVTRIIETALLSWFQQADCKLLGQEALSEIGKRAKSDVPPSST